MSAALRHSATRWIAAVYALVAILDWAISFVLVIAVFEASSSSTLAAILLVAVRLSPAVVLPVLGARLETVAPRRVLPLTFVAEALALLCIAALGAGVAALLLGVVTGVAGAVQRSQLRAALARSTEGALFRGGSALINTASATSSLAGPALAGLLVLGFGAAPALVVLAVAAFMLACSLLLPAARGLDRAATRASVEGDDDRPVAARMPGSGSVGVTGLLVLVGVASLAFSMDEPVLLVFSKETLGAGVAGYSLINVAWAAGIVVGTLVFSRLLNRSMLAIYVGATALVVAAHLGLAISPGLSFALVACVIGGIGNGMDWVAITTAIQEAAPRGSESLTASRVEAVTTAGPAIGLLLGGALADLADPRLVLLVPMFIGLGIVVAACALARGSRLRFPAPSVQPQLVGGTR